MTWRTPSAWPCSWNACGPTRRSTCSAPGWKLLASPGLPSAGMRAYVEWQNGLLDHAAIVGDLYVESPLVHPSVTLRRAVLLGLGGYRDAAGPEDYDLWLRAHAAGLRFGKCPEVLLQWRDRADRLTRRDPRYAAARFLERKLEALLEGPLRDDSPLVVWGAGRIGKSWARRSRPGAGRWRPSWRWTPGRSVSASTGPACSTWRPPRPGPRPGTWRPSARPERVPGSARRPRRPAFPGRA